MEMPGTPATPTRPNPDGLRISTPKQAGIPDQIRHSGSGLSRHAAERHALLTAVRTTEPAPHRRGTWLTRLTATWAVNVPAELSFLKKRTS